MAWEGEVASRPFRNDGATHLTPTLSPRKRAERERMNNCTRSRHCVYRLASFALTRSVISIDPGA